MKVIQAGFAGVRNVLCTPFLFVAIGRLGNSRKDALRMQYDEGIDDTFACFITLLHSSACPAILSSRTSPRNYAKRIFTEASQRLKRLNSPTIASGG